MIKHSESTLNGPPVGPKNRNHRSCRRELVIAERKGIEMSFRRREVNCSSKPAVCSVALIGLSAILCVYVAAAQAEPSARTKLKLSAGSAAESGRRIKLRELWRAGGEDSEVVFGVIARPVETADGAIAVLDYQQSLVFTFARNGKLTRTVDLSGDGPGSVRSPSCIARLGDGRIAIAQCFPASIEIFDAEWNYLQSVPLSGNSGKDELRLENIVPYRDGYIVIGENIVKEFARNTFLFHRCNYVNVISPSGKMLKSIYSRNTDVDFSSYDYNEDEMHYVDGVAVGPSDDVFLIYSRNGYEIAAFDAAGTNVSVLSRDYESVRRREEQVRHLKALREAIWRRSIREFSVKISESEPDLSLIELSESGELRVTTSRSYDCGEPGVYCRYDMIDVRNGRFRHEDILLPRSEESGGRLFWLGGGRVVLVAGLMDAMKSMKVANEKVQGAVQEAGDEPMSGPVELVLYEMVADEAAHGDP